MRAGMDNSTESKVKDLLLFTKQEPIKHWLKMKNKHHSSDRREDFIVLLSKLIEAKKLTFEELNEAILEVNENARKTIYLFDLKLQDHWKSKETFQRHLSPNNINLSDKPFLLKNGKTQKKKTLDYVFWNESEIRIKWSETQQELKINKKLRAPLQEEVQKHILAVIDHGSGFARLHMDKPATIHEHVNDKEDPSPVVYRDYYISEMLRLVGCTPENCKPFDLRNAIEKLYQTNILDIASMTVERESGATVTYTEKKDIRTDDKIKKDLEDLGSRVILPKKLKAVWREEESDGAIQRKFLMTFETTEKFSQVSTLLDSLAIEVAYAISRITQVSS